MHVVRHQPDQLVRRLLGEEGHGIDAFERGQHLRAFLSRNQRTARALQGAHRFVTVQAHDQAIAKRARLLKVARVPNMQEVEAPVGEDDALPLPLPPAHLAR